MAVVGPSGCGKTNLIFSMLENKTFYPTFEKIYFFYHVQQNSFIEVSKRENIEFVPGIDFDLIDGLTDCLLIFDDSCEEIFNEPRFVKMAVSGRHKKISVIYVKHNLYHQSKFSRTIDLNTTHYVLFKSPRDEQQIVQFGKQLNKINFIRESYTQATSEPHGHLLIDLNPHTSEGLRYCSNIVGPGPSTFYLPPSKAVVTKLQNEKEARAYTEQMVQPTAS